MIIMFFLLVFASMGYAQGKASTEIPYLLNLIKASSFTFERNGQNGNGKSAAELFRPYEEKLSCHSSRGKKDPA